MKKVLSILLVVVLVIPILTFPVSAYKLLGTRINPNDKFKMYLHGDYNQSSNKFTKEFVRAIDDWVKIGSKSDLIEIEKSSYNARDFPKLDNKNMIYLQEDRYDRYLGKAAIWHDGTQVIEADININAAHDWVVNASEKDGLDFYSTVLHELGHLIGLDHSNDPESCMKASLDSGEVLEISDTDTQGFKVIYKEISSDYKFSSNDLVQTQEEVSETPNITPELSVFALMPTVDIDILVDISSAIIIGDETVRTHILEVQEPDGDGIEYLYNYNVKVEKVIKDELGIVGDTVNIRTECLSPDDPRVCAEVTDSAFEGRKMYFLLKPTTGGRYITEGDYFVLPYGESNIFSIDAKEKTFYNNNVGLHSKNWLYTSINTKKDCDRDFVNKSKEEMCQSGLISEELYLEMEENKEHYASLVGEDLLECPHKARG